METQTLAKIKEPSSRLNTASDPKAIGLRNNSAKNISRDTQTLVKIGEPSLLRLDITSERKVNDSEKNSAENKSEVTQTLVKIGEPSLRRDITSDPEANDSEKNYAKTSRIEILIYLEIIWISLIVMWYRKTGKKV